MTRVAHILIVSLALLFYSTQGLAEEVKTVEKPVTRRLCTDKDLKGTYMLVNFSENPPGRETQSQKLFPYKYLTFRPPTFYASIRTRKAAHSVAEAEQLLKRTTNQSEYTYALHDGGSLYLYTGKKISYSYRCVVSLASADGYQKGDLILNAYMEKGRTELHELYRRWY